MAASRPPEALVTLSCDPNLPLEKRVELLSWAFAKAVNSDVLRRVVDWDVANGRVQFVIVGEAFRTMPQGRIEAELSEGDIDVTLRLAA